jgi:hypothetical protein|tara:strand:- start:3103 stop:3477 length:375 start_codon:yes stop_codon:yes gene_type:complete
MITKRIYLIGLSTEVADMLQYDDEVMDDHLIVSELDRDRVDSANKTLIIRSDDFDSIPEDLREESVFVLQQNIDKPDFDPLVVFEFNTDLYERAGFDYAKLYFDDMFGIELNSEAQALYENTFS